ncbi:MAG: hypothetical protein ACOY3I_10345 [Verrucomicrobiota bacterium]
MISKGYVGLFKEELTEKRIRQCVAVWLDRFDRVEQVCGGGNGALTMQISSSQDVMMESHQQFRVLMGSDFTWVYLTQNRRVMETTGLPAEEISLCLDVLLELPGILEIIDHSNDKRLDQLEKEGLM